MQNKPQAIIFDMDGTLWNATASYAEIWNICSAEFGVSKKVTSGMLKQYMGKQLEDILFGLFGCEPDFNVEAYIRRLGEIEDEMMPKLGGILYPGVTEGLKQLSRNYMLIAQSNCGVMGLRNFMSFTRTTELFTDSLTYGESPVPKSENIKILMNRNKLSNAIYVGDTQGDCDNAHRAGLPFAHATYGFGQCEDADLSFDSFDDLVKYFMLLK